MRTAVDTSVLLDVFGADAEFGPVSAAALRASLDTGRVIACEVVWAEAAASFETTEQASSAMESLRIDFSQLDADAALTAGTKWRAYRKAGGTRKRIIADFLIGAHALACADRLLTRDRGFYRTYFEALEIVDPTGSPRELEALELATRAMVEEEPW